MELQPREGAPSHAKPMRLLISGTPEVLDVLFWGHFDALTLAPPAPGTYQLWSKHYGAGKVVGLQVIKPSTPQEIEHFLEHGVYLGKAIGVQLSRLCRCGCNCRTTVRFGNTGSGSRVVVHDAPTACFCHQYEGGKVMAWAAGTGILSKSSTTVCSCITEGP